MKTIRSLYLALYWPIRRIVKGILRSCAWLTPTRSASVGRRLQRQNLSKLASARALADLQRVGAKFDGGYAVPRLKVGEVEALFSPGVADIAEFELHFAELGVKCFLLDGSVSSTPISHANFHFQQAWLSSGDRKIDGQQHLSLQDWVNQSGLSNSYSLALQMDIEGFEWEVLRDSESDLLDRFKFMTIEFHELHAKASESHAELVNECFDKLLKTHSPVWIHPNNGDFAVPFGSSKRIPPLLEITFIRNDILKRDTRGQGDLGKGQSALFVENDPRFSALKGVGWLQYSSSNGTDSTVRL